MSLPNQLADPLFFLFGALALCGLASLTLIAIYWRSVGASLNETWAKLITESIQIASGVASVGAAFAAGVEKPGWFPPAIASAICLGVWKIVQVLVDNRIRAADRITKQQLDHATREGALRTRLLSVLRGAVKQKVKRLRKEVLRREAKPSLARVRNALTPKPHLDDLLECLLIFLHEQHPAPDTHPYNFRVGVYISRAGAMTPVHAVSLNDPGYNPFNSYLANADHFNLSAAVPSQVVICVTDKRMLIIEDCVKSAAEGKFSFFNAPQESYLRSMVAYYLGEVCDEDGTMTVAALVVDSDEPAFFKEAERGSLHGSLREFGFRLKLEMLLLALITKRGSIP
jgi:hypothetical protein